MEQRWRTDPQIQLTRRREEMWERVKLVRVSLTCFLLSDTRWSSGAPELRSYSLSVFTLPYLSLVLSFNTPYVLFHSDGDTCGGN